MNSDGARCVMDGRASCGGIIRDSLGSWCLGFCKFIGVCSVVEAKLWGVLIGIRCAWNLQIPKFVVEIDSKDAQRLIQSGSRTQGALGVVLHILELGARSWDVQFQYIGREAAAICGFISSSALASPFRLVSRYGRLELLGVSHNVYSLSILINCFCQLGQVDFGYSVLGKMPKLGVEPSVVTFSTLINGLCKQSKIPQAVSLFGEMVEKGKKLIGGHFCPNLAFRSRSRLDYKTKEGRANISSGPNTRLVAEFEFTSSLTATIIIAKQATILGTFGSSFSSFLTDCSEEKLVAVGSLSVLAVNLKMILIFFSGSESGSCSFPEMMFRAVLRRINIFRARLLTSGKEQNPDSDPEKKINILLRLAAKTLKLPTALFLLIQKRMSTFRGLPVKKLEKKEPKVPEIVACFAMMTAAKEEEVNSDSATSRVLGPDEISALKWCDIYKLSRIKRIQLGNQLKPSLLGFIINATAASESKIGAKMASDKLLTRGTVIEMVAHSSEFENNVVQEEEQNELAMLDRTSCPLEVRGGPSNKRGKISILIQAPLIPLHWYRMLHILYLSLEISRKLEERGADLDRLHEMEEKDIGALIRYAPGGRLVKQYLGYFPWIKLSATVSPITRTVLKVDLLISSDYIWKDRFHGAAQRWWILVEDTENEHIYHSELFTLTKKMARAEPQKLSFTVPIFEPHPPQYYICVVSDSWFYAEAFYTISFQILKLPKARTTHTELLDLKPLPVTSLANNTYESLHNFSHFNPIQTQIFHVLYHTDNNVLLGAPTGSRKTISAEFAMLHLFNTQPDMKPAGEF
ncbi:hypothetical protein V6N11_010049 [Hibiscus sabdariffa]|uniref:SEC63 domain-containing protein n=1 Tax=Hibiscus sabdariffa TaxID=183260 RepID=A0ABR2PDY4_9ROSI